MRRFWGQLVSAAEAAGPLGTTGKLNLTPSWTWKTSSLELLAEEQTYI